MSRTIPYLNTLNRTIPYLNTLNRTIPYPNTLTRTIPYLNTLPIYTLSYYNAEVYPILIHSRSIAYLNTLGRTIPYFNRLSRIIPHLNTLQSAANQIRAPELSANQNRVLRHPRALGYCGRSISALGASRLAIPYLNTQGFPPPTSSAHSSTTGGT